MRIGGQRRRPLCPVNLVLPPGLVRSDVFLRAFPECHAAGALDAGELAIRSARFYRVNAVEEELAALPRLLSRLGEAEGMHRAEPHLALAAAPLVSEQPAFRAPP